MRKAFSLIECTVSVMLVGILMAAALRSLSTSHLRDENSLLRMQGQQLCDSFRQEILSKAFAEPNSVSTSLGLDDTERQNLRATLDDVDDYANMKLAPPTDLRGNVLPGLAAWRVAVVVSWADPVTLASTLSNNTNIKRVEVQAIYAGRVMATAVSHRAADAY